MFKFRHAFGKHVTILAASVGASACFLGVPTHAQSDPIICPEPFEETNQTESGEQSSETAPNLTPIDDCHPDQGPGTPPSISVPSSSSTGNFTVSWGRSSGSVHRYELSQNTSGSSRWLNVYSGSARQRSVSLGDGRYRFRVRACGYSSCSGYRYSGYVNVAKRPGTPGSIDHPDYTKTGKATVRWGSASGSGKTYTLQQRKNNGSWATAYSGTGRSRTLNVSNGNYRFRVRACNSNGCSNYRYGNAMIANKPDDINLYAQYPFLYADDVDNDSYARTAKSFKGEFTFRDSAGQRGGALNTRQTYDPSENFNLGQGFDRLNGAYADLCLDFDHPSFRVFKTPSTKPDEFKVSYIRNTSELFNSLEITDSTNIDFTYKGISAGVDNSSERLIESLAGEHHEVFVVKIVENRESWSLSTQSDAIKSEYVSNILSQVSANSRAAFRQRCGDQYIGNTDLGSKLYLVFSYDKKRFATQQVAEYRTQIEAGVEGSLDGSYSSSEVQQFKGLLTSINMNVEAYQLGGPENIHQQINVLNFNQKASEFINGTRPDNYHALKLHYRNYPHPSSLLSYSYYQVFTNYVNDLANMRRWNYLDAERQQRCETLKAYKSVGGHKIDLNHCESMAQELQIAKDYCGKSENRTNCLHPASYYTAGVNNPNMPGVIAQPVNLYNELGNKVDYLDARSAWGTHSDSVTGGVWNKKCIQTDKYTCLTDTSCFADVYQGYNQGTGRGFGLNIKDYHSPGSGGSGIGNNRVTTRSGQTCVNTYMKACTKRIGGSKARIKFDHEVFGRCPQQKSFSMTGS